jgi:lysophospholipase L1-like esterase
MGSVEGAAAGGGGIAIYRLKRQRPAANASYVALGSSFAAGLGLGDRIPGSPLISQRSANGYPQQLARLLGIASFTDMTSSGATVRHVLHGGQMGLGPQIDALGPDTSLVTLTGGGNDVGYVGDLTAMAFGNRGGVKGWLVGLFWKGAKPASERDFAGLEHNLAALFDEIRRRSPRARIVVATYPAILAEKGTCDNLGISEAQAAIMLPVAARLAEVTRAAAFAAGAAVVDMATLSAGHDACSAAPWVNGIVPEKGAPFHPTLAGARATARAIAEALSGHGETGA